MFPGPGMKGILLSWDFRDFVLMQDERSNFHLVPCYISDGVTALKRNHEQHKTFVTFSGDELEGRCWRGCCKGSA